MWVRILVLSVSLSTLQIKLMHGSGSLPNYWRLSKAIAQQESQVSELSSRNHRLNAEVRELKRSPDALEERARSELGFIKHNETFCHIIDPKTD